MDEEPEIPEEFETNLQCPVCGKPLFLIYYRTEIAYEEAISIETYYCKGCMFKQNAIMPMERGEPTRSTLKLRSTDDLRVVVYRSPEAVIQIPEIDAEIAPAKFATGEITTVEGILQRILEKVDFVGPEADDPERMKSVRKTLDDVLNGSRPDLTLIVEDESGKSRINSSRAVKTPMEKTGE